MKSSTLVPAEPVVEPGDVGTIVLPNRTCVCFTLCEVSPPGMIDIFESSTVFRPTAGQLLNEERQRRSAWRRSAKSLGQLHVIRVVYTDEGCVSDWKRRQRRLRQLKRISPLPKSFQVLASWGGLAALTQEVNRQGRTEFRIRLCFVRHRQPPRPYYNEKKARAAFAQITGRLETQVREILENATIELPWEE